MTAKIAVNGFGRIGRLVTRIALARNDLEIAAINDLGDAEALAHLFKYDSIHGRYAGDVRFEDGALIADGKRIPFTQIADPAQAKWGELGADIVIEASGAFRSREKIEKHLAAGAKKVLLTVPSKDPIDATIVLGVNNAELLPEHKLVSNASCTTNCTTPLAWVMHQSFGIVQGFLNTVHAFTNDQKLHDAPHSKDPRRARMASQSIIPTSTGAGKAIADVIPELKGKIGAMAMRVPVVDGSIVDLVLETKEPVSLQSIRQAFEEAQTGPMRGVLEICDEPIVSRDVIGNPHSCILDFALTDVLDDHHVRLCAWYDNEWGYSNRVVELAQMMAEG